MTSCFSIVGIENGWFKVLFFSNDSLIHLWASDIGGNDVASKLINSICLLCKNATQQERICFNAESVAHILLITRHDQEFIISAFELHENPLNYIGDVGSGIYSAKIGQPLFTTSGEMKTLALNILMEFSKYCNLDYRKLYENNWQSFPESAIESLWKVVKHM